MFKSIFSAAVFTVAVAGAQAALVMPNFADVPTGWSTDRYAPASFANVGSFQGRDNVLGIGISSAQSAANRAATGQSGMFYNTQGKQHAISGGAGSSLGAALYMDTSWADSANGWVRSDIWGVMSDAVNGITDYPIIGFTNQDGNARYRVYDDGVWTDLTATINYGSWTAFQMVYDGGYNMDYFIDGSLVYTDTTIGYGEPTEGFSAVIMQAYNYGDPANFPNAVVANYTAHWSNIPEPATLALFGLALAGLAVTRRNKV